jgi:hypothetical protein
MRGFLRPAVKRTPTAAQTAFGKLRRGKRTKIAKLAQTTLVKTDQWARGELHAPELAEAIEKASGSVKAKKK